MKKHISNQTMKRRAAKLGHNIGRVETRRYDWGHTAHGQIMYKVGWCEACGAAMFSDDHISPALSRSCIATRALDSDD